MAADEPFDLDAELATLREVVEKIEARNRQPVTEHGISAVEDDRDLEEWVYARLAQRYGPSVTPGAGLPTEVAAVMSTYWFEADSLNGGIEQYVDNLFGAALDALVVVGDGYRVLELTDMAELAIEVATVLRDAGSLPPGELEARLDSLTDRIDQTGRCSAARARLIRSHPGAFVG